MKDQLFIFNLILRNGSIIWYMEQNGGKSSRKSRLLDQPFRNPLENNILVT